MKAGPALDAMVAEKVLGWKAVPGHGPMEGLTFYQPPDQSWVEYDIPEFSTEIEQAWRVVEKIKEKGHDLIIGVFCKDDERLGDGDRTEAFYRVSVWIEPENDDEDNIKTGEADTAPLAICLAALKTVEEPLPGHTEGFAGPIHPFPKPPFPL